MFKRMMITTAVLLTAAACSDTPTMPDATVTPFDALFGVGGADKVRVCHLDADLPGSVWKLLEIKNNRALERHLAHGDVVPGGDVPGMLGYVFDEACVPTTAEPKVFAVAYVDRDPGDGGYQANTDVLIAKLVDRNRDGVISAGDEVVRGQYPLDFGATALGEFGVNSSLVEFVWAPSASEVILSTGGANLDMVYFWADPSVGHSYMEDRNDEITVIRLRDTIGPLAGGEWIEALLNGGLSMPQTNVSLNREGVQTDDTFVDVEINLNGF